MYQQVSRDILSHSSLTGCLGGQKILERVHQEEYWMNMLVMWTQLSC